MIDPSSFLCADHQFLRFRPSILAAVCLAVARRQARIEPLWPARLERKTGFSLDEIADCFNFTWRYVRTHLGSLSYQACCPQNSCLPALGARVQHARECTGEAGGNGTRGNGDVSDVATLRWAYDEKRLREQETKRRRNKKNDKKKERKERTRQEKERRRKKRQVYHTR